MTRRTEESHGKLLLGDARDMRKPVMALESSDGNLLLHIEWKEGHRLYAQSIVLPWQEVDAMLLRPSEAILRKVDPDALPSVEAFFTALRGFFR